MLGSVFAALAAWIWGMVRRSFGAIPAMLWLVLSCVSLVCAAMIGILEFSRR
jgi:MFS-type transporter involved in bile tolerance (Atg22 family)